jgi:hypothetical protein
MGSGFWSEGQRAWERLARWGRDVFAGSARASDEGERALETLTDVGVLRRLLDQIEFEAIRAGRRQGKSWAEIAIRLGITRQSAWERWQDVDQPERPQRPQRPQAATLPYVSGWDVISSATEGLQDVPAAVEGRHLPATVMVPNVIGMSWNGARILLNDVKLVAVGPDPDGPSPAALGWPDGVVTDQSPESGAMVPPGSAVTLWVERGGGPGGVREPRRPKPDPKSGRKMRDEATDDVVS